MFGSNVGVFTSSVMFMRLRCYSLLCLCVALPSRVAAAVGQQSFAMSPWWQDQDKVRCAQAAVAIEGPRVAEGLEALLSENACPFLVAFFSTSSPLSQTHGLAAMEQHISAAFPSLLYVRVDADKLGIRAFLQWDIAFLPTYVLVLPATLGKPRQFFRWKGDGNPNPYDYDAVASFIARSTGLPPGNTTWRAPLALGQDNLPMLPRGSQSWIRLELVIGWILVALAVLHRWLGCPLLSFGSS